jgi:hypothetical protein
MQVILVKFECYHNITANSAKKYLLYPHVTVWLIAQKGKQEYKYI